MKNSKIKHIGIKHSIIKNSKVNNMKNKGFTLIELIVVMVILGVMAITVAPRFMNLTGEANQSVLNGVAAAINSSSAMVYGKAAVGGKHKAPSTSDTNTTPKVKNDADEDITINYGYPTPDAAGLIKALQIKATAGASASATDDFGYVAEIATNAPNSIYIFLGSLVPDGTGTGGDNSDDKICAVKYKKATSTTQPPVVTTLFTGC